MFQTTTHIWRTLSFNIYLFSRVIAAIAAIATIATIATTKACRQYFPIYYAALPPFHQPVPPPQLSHHHLLTLHRPHHVVPTPITTQPNSFIRNRLSFWSYVTSLSISNSLFNQYCNDVTFFCEG